MKVTPLWMAILAMVALTIGGCGRAAKKDVTRSPRYHFASFAETNWRAKVRLALADIEEYTGARHLYLLPPGELDPTHAISVKTDHRVVGFVPVGTRIRIKRLWLDSGEGGLLWVTATLENGTYRRRVVYLDPELLAENRFMNHGFHDLTREAFLRETRSRTWGVNPKYLESDAPPRKAKGGGK